VISVAAVARLAKDSAAETVESLRRERLPLTERTLRENATLEESDWMPPRNVDACCDTALPPGSQGASERPALSRLWSMLRCSDWERARDCERERERERESARPSIGRPVGLANTTCPVDESTARTTSSSSSENSARDCAVAAARAAHASQGRPGPWP
jgi:hypothetical protein